MASRLRTTDAPVRRNERPDHIGGREPDTLTEVNDRVNGLLE